MSEVQENNNQPKFSEPSIINEGSDPVSFLFHNEMNYQELRFNQQNPWRNVSNFSRFESTLAHQIAMNQQQVHRGGLDFYTLARGSDRSYSCSFLVNLDPDLLSLCSREDATTLDLGRDALTSHTKRIFQFISMKSGREVNQFCFGSTFVQLNPNYRRFDRMDPMTWKKEGIASHWTGLRGYRKTCCKVCCQDRHCTGCTSCKRACNNGPIRGNYDGLVVLCAITRESLPNQPIQISKRVSLSKKAENEKLPDHEMFAISLETLLSTHFMYGDPDYQARCVPSARTSILLGETQDDLRKQKKYSGYVVYVAYRLEPKSVISHSLKLSKIQKEKERKGSSKAILEVDESKENGESEDFRGNHLANRGYEITDEEDEDNMFFGENHRFGGQGSNHFRDPDEDYDNPYGGLEIDAGEEDEKLLEDLEDKQLLSRIQELEQANTTITEKVRKLEHGRTWVENRLTALESEVANLKGSPLEITKATDQ